MTLYFQKIASNPGKYNAEALVEAFLYFDNELIDARAEVKISGRVDRNSASLPGIIEYRFAQLQEIKAILDYLRILLEKVKSDHFIRFTTKFNKDISSRDADKYILSESDVLDLSIIINKFTFLENRFIGIIKGLDCKQFQITNLVKLKAAGIDDFEF